MEIEIARKALQKLESEVQQKIQAFEDQTGTFVVNVTTFFDTAEAGNTGVRKTNKVRIGSVIERQEANA